MKIKKTILIVCLFVLAAACIYGYCKWRQFNSVPDTRLCADCAALENYPKTGIHYFKVPVDHKDLDRGYWQDYYLTSPSFKKGDTPVFVFFDGQQEMTSPFRDWGREKAVLGDMPCVVVGTRGSPPNIFPEVFDSDKSVNFKEALKLYSSWQQIEDIELARKDMVAKGLIGPEGKIMLYGGSGGGILEQQYLDRYGQNVIRALMESTGAPDLAEKNGLPYSRLFSEYSPEAAKLYANKFSKHIDPSLAFMLFKLEQNAGGQAVPEKEIKLIKGKTSFYLPGKWDYFKNLFRLPLNYGIVKKIIMSPQELMCRVRIYELCYGISDYLMKPGHRTQLLYDWAGDTLSDFIKTERQGIIRQPEMIIDRAAFSGEVLVFSGIRDFDFNQEITKLLADSYKNSVTAAFDDGHTHAGTALDGNSDYYRSLRAAFFMYGLKSDEFMKYYKDKRQLIRE
mgnify:CR=1 FL=1